VSSIKKKLDSVVLLFLVQVYLVNETNAMDHIVRILHKDWCIINYPDEFWKHLTHIFEIAPDQAVENGLLEIFEFRIKNKIGEYHLWNMRCYALLLRCAGGQKRLIIINLQPT